VHARSAIHWFIDDNDAMMYLAVAVRAEGWLGFGVSENGGMLGSDILLYETATPDQVQDGHMLTARQPFIDDCGNIDWNFVYASSYNNNGTSTFLIVQVSRKLDTGDSQDRPILNDSSMEVPLHRIIATWGDTPTVEYHGSNNRVRSAVRWYESNSDSVPDTTTTSLDTNNNFLSLPAEGYFDLVAPNYTIPSKNCTTYAEFCFFWDDVLAQGVPDNISTLYVIGYEAIPDGVTGARHVHHYNLQGSRISSDELDTCQDRLLGGEMIYVWAPGEPRLELPDYVANPIGPDGIHPQTFRVQIHYDNPDHLSDLTDNSGVRFYYSLRPRQYEVGILQLGDPSVALWRRRLGDGLRQHSFHRPSPCSSTVL
jgi:hypothetical protein